MVGWKNLIFLTSLLVGCSDQGTEHDADKPVELEGKVFQVGFHKQKEEAAEIDPISSQELNPSTPLAQETHVMRNGIIRDFFEDGSIKEEVEFVEGVKQGARKIWYPTGQIAKSGSMKNDRWHGKYEEWYTNGLLKVSGYYVDGKQNGEWKFFDKEGEALPHLFFDSGVETTRKLPSLLPD